MPANNSSIYGTASFVSGLQNPLTFQVGQNINFVSFNLLNGNTIPLNYFISDNNGNATSVLLAPNLNGGNSQISFAASGTDISIRSASGGAVDFDFFIDNIRIEHFAQSQPVDFSIKYNTVTSDVFTQQLTFALIAQPVDDTVALENLKNNWKATADRATAASDTIRFIPTSVADGPSEAVKGFAVDRAVDQIGSDKTRTVVEGIQTVFDALKSGAASLVALFKMGAEIILKGAEVNFNKLANDPPDQNFNELAQRSGETLDMGFADKFGSRFSVIDQAFRDFGLGLEGYELFLTTLERMQGALVANDLEAFAKQRSAAEVWLTQADTDFKIASLEFQQLQSLFQDGVIQNFAVDPLLISQLQNDIRSQGLDQSNIEELLNAGFDDAFIQALINDILAAPIEVPTAFANATLTSIPTILADFSRNAAFSSFFDAPVNVSEPPNLWSILVICFFYLAYIREKGFGHFRRCLNRL